MGRDRSSTEADASCLTARARSFRHAAIGLVDVLRSEPNARIHALASVLVVAAGLALQVTRLDWCWLVAAMALVWVAEALNTALEALADAAIPEPHPKVRLAKDAAAAAVLLAAIAASAIGTLVLGPPLLLRLAG